MAARAGKVNPGQATVPEGRAGSDTSGGALSLHIGESDSVDSTVLAIKMIGTGGAGGYGGEGYSGTAKATGGTGGQGGTGSNVNVILYDEFTARPAASGDPVYIDLRSVAGEGGHGGQRPWLAFDEHGRRWRAGRIWGCRNLRWVGQLARPGKPVRCAVYLCVISSGARRAWWQRLQRRHWQRWRWRRGRYGWRHIHRSELPLYLD